MKQETEKLVILIVTFVVFAAGMWALYCAHGTARTVVLWGSFAILLAIAIRQTIKKKARK